MRVRECAVAVQQAVGRTGSVLWGEDFRADGNIRKRREHLRIEGRKWRVLAIGKFNE
jgi:hypothetical protein